MPKLKKIKVKSDFNSLKAKWYKKLAKEGFKDIERDEDTLKSYSGTRRGDVNGTVADWQAKAQYFQMATNFLNDYRFESEFDRTVWMYHSEGLSKYEISAIFRKLHKNKRGYGRTTIHDLIMKLRKSMFTMYLLPVGVYHE